MSRSIPSKDPVNLHICARLKKRRHDMALNQSDIADYLHISTQQYQKYEYGKNGISGAKLWHLARLFSVPVSWFYEGL